MAITACCPLTACSTSVNTKHSVSLNCSLPSGAHRKLFDPSSPERSARGITFPQDWKHRACLSDAHQGERENSALIAWRNCSPFFSFWYLSYRQLVSEMLFAKRPALATGAWGCREALSEENTEPLGPFSAAANQETAEKAQAYPPPESAGWTIVFSLSKLQYRWSLSASNSITSVAW